MISIKVEEIPHFLRSSDLYRSLTEDKLNADETEDNEEEALEFPSNYMKMELKVGDVSDLRHLLATIHYWGSAILPTEIIAFSVRTVSRDRAATLGILKSYAQDLPQFKSLVNMMECGDIRVWPEKAASIGSMQILYQLSLTPSSFQSQFNTASILSMLGEFVTRPQHLLTLLGFEPKGPHLYTSRTAENDTNNVCSAGIRTSSALKGWSTEVCRVAAAAGHIVCLRFLHEHGCPWDQETLASAVRGGHDECLEYALREDCPLPNCATARIMYSSSRLTLCELFCTAMVDGGHKMARLLPLARSRGFGWDSATAVAAARTGNLESLQYLHAHLSPARTWKANTCEMAARFGHLECLRYLHEHGCPWNACTSCAASAGGHLDCLQYTIENNCPTTIDTCKMAAFSGQLACLMLARENGCPWDKSVCTAAAQHGHLDCLEYAHTRGCPWDQRTCSWAAAKGHLECLGYAHENGCPWDRVTVLHATKNGHIDCVRYAHEHGCPWDIYAVQHAAQSDKFDCLVYLTAPGCCPWDPYTFNIAVKHGHLERMIRERHPLPRTLPAVCSWIAERGNLDDLKFAHEIQGCPWDAETCANAASNGHLDCLVYAHEQGCPWDEFTSQAAAYYGHLDCLQYAYEHGCPWNDDTGEIAASNGHFLCATYAQQQGLSVSWTAGTVRGNWGW